MKRFGQDNDLTIYANDDEDGNGMYREKSSFFWYNSGIMHNIVLAFL
jgi:hypothetical protein